MEAPEKKTQSGMFKPAVNAALLIAAALIILTLIFYLLNALQNSILTWISLAVFIAGMLYTSLAYRNENLGGYISYGKSVGFATLTGLFAGIITGVFTFIFYQFIAPELIEELRLNAEKVIYQSYPDLSYQEQEMAINMQRKFITPFWLSFGNLFWLVLQGLIFGLIASIFIKKADPDALEV